VALKSGTNIGHYKVLSRLGAGGMGEIYLAEDSRLYRKVAIKILPAEFTKDEDRVRRFNLEARAASSLNHPNIIVIHEIGQTDCEHYIVTEFVEGDTLRHRITVSRMSVIEALDISIQVAGALVAAHEAGIVHRDIKPENVMVRYDGYIKVLDFGIAKLTEQFNKHQSATEEDVTTLTMLSQVNTEPGVVMGSPNYMSPEQVRGFEIDARTDTFSLGVMLYEMIAGKKPFGDKTTVDTIASILNKEPAPLTDLCSEVTPRLEAIVARAMAKDREKRYPAIKDMLKDLKRQKRRLEFEAGLDMSLTPEMVGREVADTHGHKPRDTAETLVTRPLDELQSQTVSSAEQIITEARRHKKGTLLALAGLLIAAAVAVGIALFGEARAIESLAVMPFVNAGGDPGMDYLSDGISESLINSLTTLSDLTVMSRSSVFRYKGQNLDPVAVGRELKVQAVLVGIVSQRGEVLSVTTELVDTRNNRQIWGAQYNKALGDLLTLQQEISRDISEKLRLRLSGEDRKRLARRYTDNTEAYQLYLKGRYYWNKKTVEGTRKAIEHFEQSIAKDPVYALAYTGLSDCYASLSGLTMPPTQAMPKAREAAAKALEIDETLAEAHTSMADIKMLQDWDWAGAEKDFRRAIELNPGYASAHQWYGQYFEKLGRFDEALREMKRAQELDPLSLNINNAVGAVYYYARQYDRAIEQLKRTVEMDTNFARAHLWLGRAYVEKGMHQEAIAELERAFSLAEGAALYKAALAYAYGVSGRESDARKLLTDLLEESKRDYVSPFVIPLVYVSLGEKELAFEWLERAYDAHSDGLLYLKVEPKWDALRSDPRFKSLLERVGLTP
jgi:eukaryotic-like serine/threonine-protein kinase